MMPARCSLFDLFSEGLLVAQNALSLSSALRLAGPVLGGDHNAILTYCFISQRLFSL
jgi:hypothetical protein